LSIFICYFVDQEILFAIADIVKEHGKNVEVSLAISGDKGSISSTFYKQLLQAHIWKAHIRKAQKKTMKLSVFLGLLGSACEKVARRSLMKLTLGD